MENNLNNHIEMPVEAPVEDFEAQAHKARVKKRIVAVAAVLIMLAILAGGTLAYFTAEETAYNVITTGVLEMALMEEKKDGTPFEDVFGVMPGEAVDKIVYVKNTGNVPFYARIALDKSVKVNGKSLDFDTVISLDINTGDWIERDGYYYYKEAIQPGESSTELFTMVSFSKNMGNDYQNAKVEITVNAQAVQSKQSDEHAGGPLEAVGWN